MFATAKKSRSVSVIKEKVPDTQNPPHQVVRRERLKLRGER